MELPIEFRIVFQKLVPWHGGYLGAWAGWVLSRFYPCSWCTALCTSLTPVQVYDGVGKDTFDASLKCLGLCGLLVSFGNASGKVRERGWAGMGVGGVSVGGVSVGGVSVGGGIEAWCQS